MDSCPSHVGYLIFMHDMFTASPCYSFYFCTIARNVASLIHGFGNLRYLSFLLWILLKFFKPQTFGCIDFSLWFFYSLSHSFPPWSLFFLHFVCFRFSSLSKDHGIWSHNFMAHRWGNNGNSDKLYFPGLQNHCRWWLQPWN